MSRKEIVYIDVEDDITSIINKATKSDASIVALVLPKKTPTLKSSVNMKLLKRSMDKSKKKTVLITKESALLPLAGAAEMHVAADLKSRPSVPKTPKSQVQEHVVTDEKQADDKPEELEGSKSDTAEGKDKKKKKSKKSGVIKVPNFDRFRLRMFAVVVIVIALVVGWYVMFRIMPKANITITAKTSKVSTEVIFTLDAIKKDNNLEEGHVAGEVKEIKKTLTERFDATGEVDKGEKSNGIITIQNCDSSDEITVVSGTTFTDSATGYSFVSTAATDVPGGSFSGGGCSDPGEADVSVVSSESGDDKNLAPRVYSVSGEGALVTGFGGQMSGGTSEIEAAVSAEDISAATQTLLNKKDTNIKSELASLFGEDFVVIDETFSLTNTDPVSSVAEGTEATEATVSSVFTYTVVAVSKDQLNTLLKDEQAAIIDTNELGIIDSGINDVKLKVKEKISNTSFKIQAKTNGFVGPEIDLEALASEIAGEKYSRVIEIIKSKPGVQDVMVELAPIWVFSAPSPDKTTIEIQVADGPSTLFDE